MNKLFLSITSMLVTYFILKIVNKVKCRGPSKEDIYSQMKKAHEGHERAELIATTPMNGTCLSSIAQANLNLMESCRNG